MSGVMHALLGLSPLGAMLFKITVLLGAGWGLHGALRRANPRWRVLLWRGVLAGAALIPLLAWGGLIELPLPAAPAPVLNAPGPSMPRVVMFGVGEPGAPGGWMAAPLAQAMAAPAPPSAPPPFSFSDWFRVHRAALAWAVWGVVAALLLLRLAVGHLRLRRIVNAAPDAPAALVARLARLAEVMHCRRGVRLRLSPALGSPLLTGLRRPTILLPARMARRDYAAELPAILAHELAHLRARDLAWMLAARCLTSLLWFHPLAWRIQAAHAAACEEVSDAVAAGLLEDGEAYSSALARVALEMAGAPPAPAGIPMARCSEVTRRLRRLRASLHASPLRRRRVALALAGGGALLLGLGGLRLVRAQAPLPPAPVVKASDVPPGARVLHFPKDRALGALSIDRRRYDAPYYMTRGNWGEFEWAELGEARGDVVIPAGKRVKLEVGPPYVYQDLAPLRRLGPDDLYQVSIICEAGAQDGKAPAGFNPDTLAAPLAGLKGLKVLNLEFANIGMPGLRVLRNFTALERLHTPRTLDDEGLALACEVKTLKGLYLNGSLATPAGLAALARLPELRELVLAGNVIGDAHLEQLASLPKLEVLMIGSKGITDRGMEILAARIPTLKLLDLGGTEITDRGLASLAGLRSLEELYAHWCTAITDDGVAALKTLPALRRVDFWNARVLTNRAAEALSEIRTMESIDVYGTGMNDQALIALARLPRLTGLSLTVGSGVDPERKRGFFSAKGLGALAAARPPLKSLAIGGAGIDDAALAEIAKLTGLTRLDFFSLMNVTNVGFAQLKALKSLERMYINNSSDALTIAALKQLGTLERLRSLQTEGLVQDGSGLDLSGMPNLESLFLQLRNLQSLRDEDLAGLAGLKHLATLQVGENHELLTDRGLASLAGLTSLNDHLVIGGKRLTDEGMKSLAGMQNLKGLTIRGRIGDAGLSAIARLRSLRSLMVMTSAQFSPEGLDAVKAGLPLLRSLSVGPERVVSNWGNLMPEVGQDATDIKARTQEGGEIQLSKLNKIVMLHFWARWSPESVSPAELAQLRTINEVMGKKFPGRFMLISLALDDNDAAWRDFVKGHGLDWTQARLSVRSAVAYQYGLKTLPAYFLMTPEGKVILNPESSWKDMDAAAARALNN